MPYAKVKCATCSREIRGGGKTGLCAHCRQGVPENTTPESITERGDTRSIVKTVDQPVRTLADLIRVCEIDTETWEIVEWHANKWEMGYKDALKEAHTIPLFQVKARLRKRVVLIAAREEIERMKLAANIMPKTVTRRTAQPQGNHLLQIAIPDVHMGKLAWKPETGANYDLKIAQQIFETAVETLVGRTNHLTIGRVLFLVGSDLLHTDNPNGTTTRGTPQDTEGRFHKTFWKTRVMLVRVIDRLSEIAPVDVLVVPGNHDTQTAWHMGDSLECWYRSVPEVTINNAPTQRKYYEFGKVMLMLTHGDKGKQKDYPLLMATEQPQMFARTVHRECHTGHIHQLQTREQHGVRVRVSPALCAADAWHAENQYVGNARAAEAFVWHPVEGLISQATWTVPAEDL